MWLCSKIDQLVIMRWFCTECSNTRCFNESNPLSLPKMCHRRMRIGSTKVRPVPLSAFNLNYKASILTSRENVWQLFRQIIWSNQLFFENSLIQLILKSKGLTLRKKCPYSELLWSTFSRIRTKYPYSVQMRENAD